MINSMGSMASSMNFMASWWVPMVLCRESNWICWALFSTARVMGIAAMSPIAPMMAMVISPAALLPAIVFSHRSFAVAMDELPKVPRHCSILKKAAARSSIASLKSSSSPPRFVKNDILATSSTHICIGMRPLLSFF